MSGLALMLVSFVIASALIAYLHLVLLPRRMQRRDYRMFSKWCELRQAPTFEQGIGGHLTDWVLPHTGSTMSICTN